MLRSRVLSLGFVALAATCSKAQFTESELQAFLINRSAASFPTLKAIAQSIWSTPELSLSEVYASDLIADHFETQGELSAFIAGADLSAHQCP